MFSPARFVAIDDNPTHLQAIKFALQSLGTTCLDVLYKPEEPIDPFLLRGARIVFMDFHLSGLSFSSDPKMDNSTIASIIKTSISGGNQPYILVIWTQYPDKAAQLDQFLRQRLSDNPALIPLSVLCINKESFLNIDSGAIKDVAILQTEILSKISANPSMAALLDWEYTVHQSASRVSSRIGELLPLSSFSDGSTDTELNIVMSRFAVANGVTSAISDPRSSFAYAVAPLLADEVLHANGSSEAKAQVWKQGTSKVAEILPNLSQDDAARFNRMAHISPTSSETFNPSDWGAVVSINTEKDRWFTQYLGLAREDVWRCLGLHGTPEAADGQLVMVRAGAQCDFAQQKSGPITYIVGGLVSPPVKKWKNTPAASVKRSVTFVHDEEGGSQRLYQLHVDTRLVASFTAKYSKRWAPLFRLRESLMSQILSLQAAHASRPGILEFS